MQPVEYEAQYDCLINNGRMLEHFHEGNLTNKSKGIQSKVPDIFVEVSPELAKERGIADGALLRLVSPYGALKLNALVTDRVQGNELFLPMNSVNKDSAINFLTGPAADVNTSTPAYKQTKVRVEVLKAKENHHFLVRTHAIKSVILKMVLRFIGNGIVLATFT